MDIGFLKTLAEEELRFKKFSIVGTSAVLASGNLKVGYAVNIGAGAERGRAGASGEGTGACCYSDDSCIITTYGECIASGGGWLGLGSVCAGAVCSVGHCTSPAGACCIGATCYCLTETACGIVGGTFHGAGSPCFPSPCGAGLPTGACEHPDGSCSITLETDCDHIWHGAGSNCINACCFSDGSCVADQVTAVCLAAGGIDSGYGTGCDPNVCPLPGACCNIPFPCTVILETECTGTYFGDGSTCEDIDCEHDVYCPDPDTYLCDCPCDLPCTPETDGTSPRCCSTGLPICGTCFDPVGGAYHCCCCTEVGGFHCFL